MTTEKHVLWFREELDEDPKKIREFPTYREALIAGMAECGRAKFWVEHLKREGPGKWVPFCPEPLRLSDLTEAVVGEDGIVPVLDPEALEELSDA